MTKMKQITKQEFCKATHTRSESWLFKGEDEHPIDFHKEVTKDGTVYHFNQGREHRMFKDMPKYGEIWHCIEIVGSGRTSLWSTWTIY